MFLKTQEDLDELLRDYPPKDYEIEIRRGISKDGWTSSNDNNAIWLHVGKFKIFPYDGGIELSDSIEDGSQVGKFYRHDYVYGVEGIEVLSLWKKLSHTEDSELEKYPLILNGVDLRDKEPAVRDLYTKGTKLGIMLGHSKLMFHVCQNVRIDPETFNNSYEGTYFYHFLGQSIGLHLATIARKIGDTDKNNNLSVKTYSKQVKKCGILPDDQTEEAIEAIWKDDAFKNEINKWILHADETYVKDRVSNKRSSDSSVEITIEAMQNELLKKNVESLFVISDAFFKKMGIQHGIPINGKGKMKLSLTVV